MELTWLPDAHRQLCGLDPSEVHEALGAGLRWPRLARDPQVGLRVLTIWARTGTGRPLVVAVRQHSGWEWQCVGARDMTEPEQSQFEAWEADR